MSVFYDLSKTPRNILNQAIVRAIVSENNGLLFDPSDLSTLYQDAAGTTPVTAVEQPVGLMLDKSGNGYHATQSITASRPTLSARYNLLTKTEDFADADAWGGEINLTTTSNTAIAPDGTLTGDTLTTPVVAHAKFQAFTCAPNTQYTFSFFAKRGTMTDAKYSVYDLTSGADIVAATSYYSALNADTFSRVSITFTTPANCVSCRVYPLRDSGVIGTIHVWGADVRLGLSGPYQRVNTATDYDTDPRYFPKYLRFDGVDDYLNLPYMGLYANGSASVVAGVYGHQFGKTYNGRVICESLVSSNSPTYALCIDKSDIKTINSYMRNNTGTTFVNIDMSLPQNSTNIISIVDGGNSIKSFQNAVQKVSATYTRSGSVTLDSTTIGKGLNNGSEEIWMGELYSLIITKSALTDAQRIACERHAGRKVGVTL